MAGVAVARRMIATPELSRAFEARPFATGASRMAVKVIPRCDVNEPAF